MAQEGRDRSRELVDAFKRALAEEDAEELNECLYRLGNAIDAGEDAGPAFFAVLKQLYVLVSLHGKMVKKWREEDPQFAANLCMLMERLGEIIDGLPEDD